MCLPEFCLSTWKERRAFWMDTTTTALASVQVLILWGEPRSFHSQAQIWASTSCSPQEPRGSLAEDKIPKKRKTVCLLNFFHQLFLKKRQSQIGSISTFRKRPPKKAASRFHRMQSCAADYSNIGRVAFSLKLAFSSSLFPLLRSSGTQEHGDGIGVLGGRWIWRRRPREEKEEEEEEERPPTALNVAKVVEGGQLRRPVSDITRLRFAAFPKKDPSWTKEEKKSAVAVSFEVC